EIEDVVKQIIQREQSEDDRRYREEYRNKIHEGSFLWWSTHNGRLRYRSCGRQSMRTSRINAATADNPAATVASCFCPSRQGRFPITSSRKPPSMCTSSRNTRPLSASFTSGWSLQRRKLSSRASPSMARPSVRKCSGRKTASARPESRCTSAAAQSAL